MNIKTSLGVYRIPSKWRNARVYGGGLFSNNKYQIVVEYLSGSSQVEYMRIECIGNEEVKAVLHKLYEDNKDE